MGGLAGVAIACDENVLRGGDVTFVNKNDPWGDGERGLYIFFAWGFVHEVQLPVTRIFPRGVMWVCCMM